MKRATDDAQSIKRLRKFISSRNPEVIEKRKAYAIDPRVKMRRKELNQERRYLHSILVKMVERGIVRTEKGDLFKIINNRLVVPETQTLYGLDCNRDVVSSKYKDEISLMSIPYKQEEKNSQDDNFSELLKRFVEGDPEVISLVSKKRVVTETVDPTIEKMRAVISVELRDCSSSNSNEHD